MQPVPEAIHGGGTVSIQAIPDLGCRFIQWTGDLVSFGSNPAFSLQLFISISATAVFHRDQPCRDANTADPLMNMAILLSRNNGISGGTYGNGRGRMHYGIDLASSVGTPIYALFDGIVEQAVDWYDQNVEWINYESQYSDYGESCYNAGNRVRIKSTINSEVIYVKYMHMDQVNILQGQLITAGALIGTVGSTGSACSPRSNGPHLHLEVLINGYNAQLNAVNPESFLFTKFDYFGKITRSCINN